MNNMIGPVDKIILTIYSRFRYSPGKSVNKTMLFRIKVYISFIITLLFHLWLFFI